jgi:hypothetical protein
MIANSQSVIVRERFASRNISKNRTSGETMRADCGRSQR